jgi:hypothetical protein
MKFFKKIKINPIFIWQAVVVAFLTALVVLLILNINFFTETRREIEAFEENLPEFIPKSINSKLLETVTGDLEDRSAVFENSLLKSPQVPDPSF